MDEPNLQPLAALLASHPEECAEVVALLATGGPAAWHWSHIADHARFENLRDILAALTAADIVTAMSHDRWVPPERVDRVAIARMGAAAWLAARCGGEAVAP